MWNLEAVNLYLTRCKYLLLKEINVRPAILTTNQHRSNGVV